MAIPPINLCYFLYSIILLIKMGSGYINGHNKRLTKIVFAPRNKLKLNTNLLMTRTGKRSNHNGHSLNLN